MSVTRMLPAPRYAGAPAEVDYRVVTVALDLSRDADRAIAVGRALAVQWGASLELLTVRSPGLAPTMDDFELARRAEEIDDLFVATRTVPGDTIDWLLAIDSDPDNLLVMASHGRSRLGELVLGSASAAVTRRALRPLVLVGEHARPATERFDAIVVALDHTHRDVPAAAVAGAWALRLGLPVHAAHVRTHGHRRDSGAAEELEAAGVDVIDVLLPPGDVAAEIDGYARTVGHALTIVATEGRGSRGRSPGDSITTALVRRLRDPLVVATATGLG